MYQNHYNGYNWNTGDQYGRLWGGDDEMKSELEAALGDKKYLQKVTEGKTDMTKMGAFVDTNEPEDMLKAVEAFYTTYNPLTDTVKDNNNTTFDFYDNGGGENKASARKNKAWEQKVSKLLTEFSIGLASYIEHYMGDKGQKTGLDDKKVDKLEKLRKETDKVRR